MYHLSKELSGIVLPADTFGSHLKDGQTIDDELDQRNFEAAGEVLAEVWPFAAAAEQHTPGL